MTEICPNCKRGKLIPLGDADEFFEENTRRETVCGVHSIRRYRCPICKKYYREEINRRVDKTRPLSNHEKRKLNRRLNLAAKKEEMNE